MQGEEPATRLVYTLIDEVTWEGYTLINQILILKWIVNLSVWHRTRIEPNINKIGLALHRLTAL